MVLKPGKFFITQSECVNISYRKLSEGNGCVQPQNTEKDESKVADMSSAQAPSREIF